MQNYILKAIFTAAVLSALAACSQAPAPSTEKKKEEAQKPLEPVAAQTAFFEMYKPARNWAKDLLPLSLASNEIPGVKNEGGKAAMWTAVFVSPTRREACTFFWAMKDSGTDIHQGVSIGGTQPWTGPVPKSQYFQITEFAVNSDVAYKTAYTKGEDWLKKHPDLPVALFLGKSSRFPAPVWYIQWGTSKLGYAAFVNATTGELVKK
ncbi:MAG TPA: hypothetical protein VMJ34_14570 [Bryobacteraceae bacterium]|nr:hypothetical protein [Bryobacteraceae bacterium]